MRAFEAVRLDLPLHRQHQVLALDLLCFMFHTQRINHPGDAPDQRQGLIQPTFPDLVVSSNCYRRAKIEKQTLRLGYANNTLWDCLGANILEPLLTFSSLHRVKQFMLIDSPSIPTSRPPKHKGHTTKRTTMSFARNESRMLCVLPSHVDRLQVIVAKQYEPHRALYPSPVGSLSSSYYSL